MGSTYYGSKVVTSFLSNVLARADTEIGRRIDRDIEKEIIEKSAGEVGRQMGRLTFYPVALFDLGFIDLKFTAQPSLPMPEKVYEAYVAKRVGEYLEKNESREFVKTSELFENPKPFLSTFHNLEEEGRWRHYSKTRKGTVYEIWDKHYFLMAKFR